MIIETEMSWHMNSITASKESLDAICNLPNCLTFKQILCVFVWMLGVQFGYAQYNNIYLFDCTKSMIYPTEEYHDKSKEDRTVYWNPAKEALRNLFVSCEENDQLTIILFQDEVIDVIRGKRRVLSWDDIEERLEKAVKKSGNTCVCTAWEIAEKYFLDTEYNFFYIFTDGNPEDGGGGSPTKCKNGHNINSLSEKIANFCRENRRGFFVEISDKATNEKIHHAIEGTNCMKVVGKNVYKRKFGLFSENQVFAETSGMKDGGASKSSPLRFSRKGNYNLSVDCNDSFFDVVVIDGGIRCGNASFAVSLKNPNDRIEEIKRLNNNDDHYNFDVTISSNDVLLLDSTIHVQVMLKPIRSLTLPATGTNYIKLGETDYYDDFFIPFLCKAKSPEILIVNLSPEFNDEAKLKKASVEFCVRGLPKGCKLYFNDSLCINGVFKIQSVDSDAKLGILFPHGIESKDYEATLTVNCTNNLDQLVGGANGFYPCPNDYSIKMHATVNKSWNPLTKVLFVIAILFVFLICMWVAIVHLFIKRFKRGRRLIISFVNGNRNIIRPLRGYQKVVLKDKRDKYSIPRYIFKLLFCRRTLIIINPLFNPPLEIFPYNDTFIKVKKQDAYLRIDGRPLNGDVEVQFRNPNGLSLSINNNAFNIKYQN